MDYIHTNILTIGYLAIIMLYLECTRWMTVYLCSSTVLHSIKGSSKPTQIFLCAELWHYQLLICGNNTLAKFLLHLCKPHKNAVFRTVKRTQTHTHTCWTTVIATNTSPLSERWSNFQMAGRLLFWETVPMAKSCMLQASCMHSSVASKSLPLLQQVPQSEPFQPLFPLYGDTSACNVLTIL